jgi:catechol 2,3-dioxygenase-like lactoylglutathione lyase family enzyme
MPRGIDHVAHAVRDLDAAADFYRRAGFTVSARNLHPPIWGTQNHIIQLPGSYIEILGLADTSQTAPHALRYFSFGAFARDFLARWQGIAMLALEGKGASDADVFRTAGVGDFELFELAREAKRPDGTTVKLAFSLAFARDRQAPAAGFFTCQHHHPENFWNAEFQKHPNTATGVAGVVLVADNPSEHHAFLSAFAGQRELLATSSGLLLKTPRGEIAVMTPTAFVDHFGVSPPDISGGARFGALRFAVSDLDRTAALFDAAKIISGRRLNRLVINPETAMGATLSFENR